MPSFIDFVPDSLKPLARFISDSGRVACWRRIHRPIVHGKVLDVGCDDGKLSSGLQADSVVGIDPYVPEETYIPVVEFDGYNIPFGDKEFDTVFCQTVLHHSRDPEKLINEMRRVGKRIVIVEDRIDTLPEQWTTMRFTKP